MEKKCSFSDRLSAKLTVAVLRYPKVFAGITAIAVMMPFATAFAGPAAGVSNTGQNLLDTAKAILSPVGFAYGGWHTYQAFSSDHDKGKHVMKAIGGFAVGLWDTTINAIKSLVG